MLTATSSRSQDILTASLVQGITIMTDSEPLKTVVTGDATSQIVEILDHYLAELQRGVRPDRERLLAEHPELADQLEECLSGIDFLNGPGLDAAPGVLGDFRIVREVGRGGMGVVYEAEQISLKRRVALKVLTYGGSGSEGTLRFRREAETVAELHHTNIVPIFAVGSEGRLHYYAMQFIEGRSLAEFTSDRPRAPRDLAGWALQASEALAHAHQRGVVHRDVKPSNLILDPQGRIWLTDFGLAKRADDLTLSVAGALLGTPRYMSPEQAAAATRPVDHRTDIYSLGASLYELATGRPIFQADTAHAVILQIINSEPKPIRSTNPTFPRDLETIILKCIAKDVKHRYQSAAELSDDLRAFLDERPIRARRISLPERLTRWARRNPLIASLSAALALALVGGLIATTSLWAVAEDRREKAEGSALAAGQERDKAKARLWDSLYEQARSERLAGNRWRSLEVITEANQLRSSPLLRQEAIEAIASSGVRLVATLGPQDYVHYGDTPRMSFSFDGSLIATPTHQFPTETGNDGSGVKVWEVASGQLVAEIACTDQPLALAFSPTEELLALAGDDQMVRLVEPRTGTLRATFPGRLPLHFSRDGALLAASGETGIVLHDVSNGDLVRQLPQGMPIGFVSSDLLLVRNGAQVESWNIHTDEQHSISPSDRTPIWTVEPGPIAGDGALVALRSLEQRNGLSSGVVAIWNAEQDQVVAELPEVGDIAYSAALPLSASSEIFLYPDPELSYAVRMFDLRLGENRRPLLAPGTSAQPLSFGRFNADGTILAAQEGDFNVGVRLWNVETAEPVGYLHDQINPVWSPDGRYLAVIGSGEFEVAEGIIHGGNRTALLVYEVVAPVATASVRSRPSSIVFRRDGTQLAVDGSLFEVRNVGRTPRLRPLSATSDSVGHFVSTADSLWRYSAFLPTAPGETVLIERLTPEPREFALGGIEREEGGALQKLAVSPDGQQALLEWERKMPLEGQPNSYNVVNQIELWDLNSLTRTSLTPERPFGRSDYGVLRFSPDGERFVVTESGDVMIHDSATGELLCEARVEIVLEQRPDFLHTSNLTVHDVAFSSDSTLLACAAGAGRICLIDVASGKIEGEWTGHKGDVTAIAIIPDNHWIATAGADHMVRLWDADSHEELASWSPHPNTTTAIQFSPDGRCLVTASADGAVKLWDLPTIREQLAAIGLDW